MRRLARYTVAMALVAVPLAPSAHAQLRWIGELCDDSLAGPGFFSRLVNVFAGGEYHNRMELPFDVCFSGGEFLVLVRGTNQLLVIDGESRKARSIGDVENRLVSPVTVVGTTDELYVSDSEQGVVFLVRKGKLSVFADSTAGLVRPTGLALDSARGRLWVVDTGCHEALCFASDGRLLLRVGGRGEADSLLNFPTFAAVAGDGAVVINDTMNGKIKKFSPEGELVWAAGGLDPEHLLFERAKDLAIDDDGRIFVVDNLSDQIVVLSPDGEEVGRVGTSGSGPAEFWSPVGVAICSDTLVVADTQNHRLALFAIEHEGEE